MQNDFLGVGVVNVGEKIQPHDVPRAVHTLVQTRRGSEWFALRESMSNLFDTHPGQMFGDLQSLSPETMPNAPFVKFPNGGFTDGALSKDDGFLEAYNIGVV